MFSVGISIPLFVSLFWFIFLLMELAHIHTHRMFLPCYHPSLCLPPGLLHRLWPVWETIYATANLSVYPLFYLYISRLTNSETNNKRRGFYVFARICFAVQVIGVWVFGSRRLRQYKARLDNYFSDDRSRQLQQLHILLQLFAGIAVVSMLLNLKT